MKIANSVLELIGNTPIVKLNSVTKTVEATILAKCEYLNPSGSIKDRIALRMIEEAMNRGEIKPGCTITDASTGNTGIALSFISAVKGYRAIICMPKGWANPDRVKQMEAYGAEIIEISPGEEVEAALKGKSVHGGVIELIPRIKCLEMEKTQPNTWWARQSLNFDNVAAHRETTGKEIIEQTDGKVDAFVAAIGTGGTLLGVAEALKEKNPNIKIYGIEPDSTRDFSSMPRLRSYMKKYGIPGIRGSIIDELRERKDLVDEVFLVEDKDALNMAHRLCEEEGLFVGMSSGANVFAALKVAKKLGKGKTIVTILVDRRDRYLTVEHFTT
jgi:cysteine synthase A